MSVFIPKWIRDRLVKGNAQPAVSQAPHLVCRVESPKEKRGSLAIDHWGVRQWANLGHGKYIWHCIIDDLVPWLDGGHQVPETEDRQLIYMEQRRLRYGGELLMPGLYFGKCTHGEDGYQWWVKVQDAYYRVSSKGLFWVPLPVNEE